MRNLIRAAVLVAGVTAAAPAFAQWHDQAYTTRIETRPFYGATVTVEHGVRVFRGLPPTRQVIINPHGQTPLNLGFEDTRIYEKSESHNHYYDHSGDASPVFGGIGYGYAGRDFRRGGKRFRGKRHGGLRGHPRGGNRHHGMRRGGRH